MKSFKFWITSTEDGESYYVWEDGASLKDAIKHVHDRFRDGAVDIEFAKEVRS